MRIHISFITIMLTLATCVAAANAEVIVSEDFESYADTAAMKVKWGSAGLGTLDKIKGNPGQSAYHPGGAVNSWIGSTFSIKPTAEDTIVLSADIYDDGTSANERLTVGLRNGANPLFEMGHYNSTAEHYHVRVLNMYGNENWVPIEPGLKASSKQPAGWNRYEATFTLTSLTVTLDLGSDGTIDGTFESLGSPSANAFVDLRFGGPSNLSSAGGGAYFDNIGLDVVPEPATFVLFALGMIGCVALVRRRTA